MHAFSRVGRGWQLPVQYARLSYQRWPFEVKKLKANEWYSKSVLSGFVLLEASLGMRVQLARCWQQQGSRITAPLF